MSNEAKNINMTSIEDLVNSSLDIAAEEILNSSSPSVDDTLNETDNLEIAKEEQKQEPEAEIPVISEETVIVADNIQTENIQAEPAEEVTSEPMEDFNLNSPIEVSDSENEIEVNENIELIEEEATSEPEDTEQKVQAESPIELIQCESIDELENEVSELESEIQTQMDKLAIKADHLKANIQSELTRVSSDNEQLQQQVTTLMQQLAEAETKIQSLAEVQDRQQATIQKLITILKGVNTKITHLYDEK